MLRWRLFLGSLLISTLVGLCWLDFHATTPGLYLLGFAVVVGMFGTSESLRMFHQGIRLLDPDFLVKEKTEQTLTGKAAGKAEPTTLRFSKMPYLGTLLILLCAAAPVLIRPYPANCPIGYLGWVAIGSGGAMLLLLFGGVREYCKTGKPNLAGLAAEAFTVFYVGGLLAFLIQLRILPLEGSGYNLNTTDHRWGMVALVSMIAVVKACDTGAYTFGRLFGGRLFGDRKMIPSLSPGKTWEGILGGVAAACFASWVMFGPVVKAWGLQPEESAMMTPVWSWVLYGVVVGLAGAMGDLAESLLKRSSGVKDSSTWMPGFGGVLDLLDSLLVAAPVAYAFWILKIVGP